MKPDDHRLFAGTQHQLAAAFGVDARTIGRWLEQGAPDKVSNGYDLAAWIRWYVGNKAAKTGRTPRLLHHFSLWRFLLLAVIYTLAFHLATGAGIEEFSFGLVKQLQADPILQYSPEQAKGFYAVTAINAVAAVHYYVDSFIWKVSDTRTQEGL